MDPNQFRYDSLPRYPITVDPVGARTNMIYETGPHPDVPVVVDLSPRKEDDPTKQTTQPYHRP